MFNLNLCDRIIDIGLPVEVRKQYLLVMTPRKTVLHIGQLLVRILNSVLFFRGIQHSVLNMARFFTQGRLKCFILSEQILY